MSRRRTEIDKVEIEAPATQETVENAAAHPVLWKQKPFLLGMGIALAAATISIYLARGLIFLPASVSSTSAPTSKGRPGPDGFDPHRALLAARGQYDPATSTYFAAVALPVHAPREVRVLSFLLGFGLNPQHSPETQARLQERIPAIRQAIEQIFLDPAGGIPFEESSQWTENIKTRITAAAVEVLKTPGNSPTQGIEKVFVTDFLYH